MRTGLDMEPVYSGLSDPLRVLGVGWRSFAGNVIVLVLMAGTFHLYWWAIPAVFIHVALWMMSRRDPEMAGIYWGYARQTSRYEPVAGRMRQGDRPLAMGRGALL